MAKANDKMILTKQNEDLLGTLKTSFERNMNRHKGLEWSRIQAKPEENTAKL